jgi:hypothetical protein
MATYGRGQMLGSGINPESFKQDYSGFANAAAIRAQGLSNLGASIGGVIKEFGEVKKEQKKVDAYNKASAKAIEAAITLGGSYGITGAEETLRPFLEAYNDPNLSPIEKAALLDEGKGMIPNVFGRFDQSQAVDIQRAQLDARSASSPRSVNLQQGTITEIIDGKQYEVPTIFDPSTGETRRLDGSVVGSAFRSPDVIDAELNLPMGEQTAMPGDGTFPNYGSAAEAMVLPPLPANEADAIAAAADLTGGRSDVANATPIPMGAPTNMEAPSVDGVPTSIASGRSSMQLPPGATPVQSKALASFRRATPEEAAGYGAAAGQIDEQTGRFYPINLPSGMTVESDGQGGIKVVQGAGVGGKAERAEGERKKQQGSFVNEFTKTAAEAITMLPNLPDNPIGAKFGAILGKLLPATPEGRVVSRLETLKANLALDKINQMRAASPTGGAAGTMTVQEWPLFMQEFGSLDAAEDKTDLAARLKNASVKLFNRVNGTPEERALALKDGRITDEQNKIVEGEYNQMLSDLGIKGDTEQQNLFQPSQLDAEVDSFLNQ